MKINRRRFVFLGLGAIAGGGMAYSRFVEPAWLALRRLSVSLTPGPSAPVRILHISDLHWSEGIGRRAIEQATAVAPVLEPDLICLTGDFVTAGGAHPTDAYRALLERLSRTAPCLACLGNHDGGRWSAARGGAPSTAPIVDLLQSVGIRVLQNASVAGPAGLVLVGMSDLWSGAFAADPAFASIERTGDRPIVALAHNPDTKDAIEQYPWQLMLSGHTHGGQVVIPLLGAPVVPVRDRRYLGGLKPWGERYIHVSRGVGSLYGIRFNCRPEVTLLEVR